MVKKTNEEVSNLDINVDIIYRKNIFGVKYVLKMLDK